MQWNAIQLDAKAKGCLVFAMSQGQTAVLTQPGPWGSAFDGSCIGLAANWISLAYHGKDFPVVGDVCDNPPWQASWSQNLSDAVNEINWTDYWKAAIEPFHCRLSDGLHVSRPVKPSADLFWSVMSQSYGCFGVTLRGPKSAHAIALRHGRDNRYHLFDSNYFHVAMKGVDKFKTFVDAYLASTGYAAKYITSTSVAGIRPPITAVG